MNSSPKKIALVTGASGFIGHALSEFLLKNGWEVKATFRADNRVAEGATAVLINDIDGSTDWTEALSGVEVIFHLAARAHILNERESEPDKAFLKVNAQGTQALARKAANSGVKRIVYVSTIGVNGADTQPGRPFTEIDPPHPHNAYTRSKLEAEQVLMLESSRRGLEIVIVRPPLVYGGNAPGNFAQMIKVLRRGIPLPLASVSNRRSLIYIDNLVDALIACATHPAAAGQTYLVSDGEDVSTPELLRRLGDALGKPARLFPCPPALLSLAGKLTGRSAQIERLLGSLRVDSARIRRELDWHPPYTLQQGLQGTAEWHRANRP
jgi:nucleoside-diphosphate-sugar epimerase